MSEIQFLLDLILNCKLPKLAKEKCLARIGEVESKLASSIQHIQRPVISPIQAPSTQRLLEETEKPVLPKTAIPGEVTTHVGNGTAIRGPRKW